jgi:nitrile hydratase subunit beta
VNGMHDLGGMHGMGPVEIEPDEPVFHHEWERRVFAMTMAAAFLGRWNIDMSRHAREWMPPAEYLATSYYEHWLWALELLLGVNGLVRREEIERRLREQASPSSPSSPASPGSPPPGVRVLRAADVDGAIRAGASARVVAGEEAFPPRFSPGDRIRARTLHPTGHTRLPRYARGREGVVDRDHGVWVFPDTSAAGIGKKPQHVYSVRFAARELWGPDASPRDSVFIDLWDDYLDPA